MTARLTAILWHAIAKAASKLADRSQLEVGTHPVDLTISGRVNGRTVYERLMGNLVVNPDTQRTKSTACDQTHLVAYFLSTQTKAARKRTIDSLADQYRANGNKLPDVDQQHLAEAKVLLEQLRISELVHCAGSVSYQSIATDKAAA